MSICCINKVYAQTRELRGTILNESDSTPLDGAVIILKKPKAVSTTNEKGNFVIQVPDKGSFDIAISYVGYQSKTVKVSEKEDNISVRLTISEKNKTEDVVVVGVQQQLRRNTTSAISSVSGKDFENIPASSVDQLLQGRVAGLNVQISSGEPGVAPTLVVRGNTKISTNIGDNPTVSQAQAMSGPLYVIDGVPINADEIANTLGATGTNFLAGININDIESVDVQKDAAATAAWGSRGANGVIYIKTKKGKSLTPEFRVNVYGGVVAQPKLLKTPTGAAERQQKLDLINQYANYPGNANTQIIPQILTDKFNPSFNNTTDWQGLFYRNAPMQNIDATINAASDILSYRLSTNFYNENGIIKGFGLKRYSLRGNFDYKISKKLNAQFIIGWSRADRQRGSKYDNSSDNTPFPGGSLPSSFYYVNGFDSSSFAGLTNRLRNKNIDDYYSGSLTVNYSILPDLKYTFQGSANITASNRDYFKPSNIDQIAAIDSSEGGQAPQPNQALSVKGTFSQYFISNTLNFIKRFPTGNGKTHGFVFTGSQQFSSTTVNSSTIQAQNLPSNDIQVIQGALDGDFKANTDYLSSAMLSYIGQLQYDYNGKYLLYGSYRGDASSRFGIDSKWGYFPAVGAGWIVSDEKFMDKAKNVISFLKLRGSYGYSGSESGDFYAPYNSYVIAGTYNGSTSILPNYNNGLTKKNLTWAQTVQKDLGFDLQLWNNRIGLTVDVYDKLSKDGFWNFALPFYTGFNNIDFNAKDLWVSNRGVDVTLNTRLLPSKNPFQWNMTFTLSYNKNLIAKLPDNNRTYAIKDYSGNSRIYAVGQPIYEFFQLKYLGVYNHESEIPFDPVTGRKITYKTGEHPIQEGDPKWFDADNSGDVWDTNQDGTGTGDRVPTGNPNPKFTGGWVNSISYKNFSMNILSVFTWKRAVVNSYLQRQIGQIIGGEEYTPNTVQRFASLRMPDLSGLNYWTPEKAQDPNYKAGFPAINPFGWYYYQNTAISSMYNIDGSYLKISNISLNYQLPVKWISALKLKGARIYGMVDNVVTFSNGSLPNPELVDQLGTYTGGNYPTPRKFTFGVDIQF